MLLKGKPELSFMVATMLDFYPSLEDYKNKGILQMQSFVKVLLL